MHIIKYSFFYIPEKYKLVPSVYDFVKGQNVVSHPKMIQPGTITYKKSSSWAEERYPGRNSI